MLCQVGYKSGGLGYHVCVPVHVKLHLGRGVAVAQTQVGLGGRRRCVAVQQGVEVETHT